MLMTPTPRKAVPPPAGHRQRGRRPGTPNRPLPPGARTIPARTHDQYGDPLSFPQIAERLWVGVKVPHAWERRGALQGLKVNYLQQGGTRVVYEAHLIAWAQANGRMDDQGRPYVIESEYVSNGSGTRVKTRRVRPVHPIVVTKAQLARWKTQGIDAREVYRGVQVKLAAGNRGEPRKPVKDEQGNLIPVG